MRTETAFNPLDKKNLGVSVADALVAKPAESMPIGEQFEGAGIYALYYTGAFPAYESIAERNSAGRFGLPIYVGKAVPAGSRKGMYSLDVPPGRALCERLDDHVKSIEAASNLQVTDFLCRVLVVDDIWIPLGETLLIERFRPVWNVVVDGFGNHDPGSGRYRQKPSAWDVLHPGRQWVTRLTGQAPSRERIAAAIRQHFAGSET